MLKITEQNQIKIQQQKYRINELTEKKTDKLPTILPLVQDGEYFITHNILTELIVLKYNC